MNIVVVVPPPVFPVSLEELYTFLRLDPVASSTGFEHPDDEMLLTHLGTATEKVEAALNRTLVRQTIELILPSFICGVSGYGSRAPSLYGSPAPPFTAPAFGWDAGIQLRRPPVASVNAVRYLDTNGDEQTVDPSSYSVSTSSFMPKLYLPGGFPSTATRDDAVRIEYIAGYAPDGSGSSEDYRANIPKPFKSAVMIEVQLLYDKLSPQEREALEKTVARITGHQRIHSF